MTLVSGRGRGRQSELRLPPRRPWTTPPWHGHCGGPARTLLSASPGDRMAAQWKTGPVRYAVVGLGYISQSAVLPAFAHAKRNSVLAALVSDDPKKLAKL